MPCGSERIPGGESLLESAGSTVVEFNAGCDCETSDLRAGLVGNCFISFTVESSCEQIVVDGDGENTSKGDYPSGSEGIDPPIFAITRATKQVNFCRVNYEVSNVAESTASITEFTVDGETFVFPTPIAPGNNDTVRILRQQPANCDIKQNGEIKAACPNGAGTLTLDKLRVCVLSGAVPGGGGKVF